MQPNPCQVVYQRRQKCAENNLRIYRHCAAHSAEIAAATEHHLREFGANDFVAADDSFEPDDAYADAHAGDDAHSARQRPIDSHSDEPAENLSNRAKRQFGRCEPKPTDSAICSSTADADNHFKPT